MKIIHVLTPSPLPVLLAEHPAVFHLAALVSSLDVSEDHLDQGRHLAQYQVEVSRLLLDRQVGNHLIHVQGPFLVHRARLLRDYLHHHQLNHYLVQDLGT
ncbi:hypothetical protein MRX96_017895 [Rhipicephalus microplus]